MQYLGMLYAKYEALKASWLQKACLMLLIKKLPARDFRAGRRYYLAHRSGDPEISLMFLHGEIQAWIFYWCLAGCREMELRRKWYKPWKPCRAQMGLM